MGVAELAEVCMGRENIIPVSGTGPEALAQAYAKDMVMGGLLDSFEVDAQEEQNLAELDALASQFNYLNKKYFVESGRSMLLPVMFEKDEPLSVVHFEGLTFAGELVTHSTVRVGSLLGRNAIRALCLTFDNVTLLPGLDSIPDDKLLHVPAFAVADMQDMTV